MVKDITGWIKEELYPSLFDHIPQALPEHNWKRDRRGWISKTYLDGSPHRDRMDKTKVLRRSPGYIMEEGGDGKSLVTYVMERDRLPFIDAVRKLSDIARLQLPSLDAKDQESYKRAQERRGIQEEAANYMAWCLLHAKSQAADAVMEYLQGRGLTVEEVEAMGLGYLPSWDQLKAYLVKKGFTEEAILEAVDLGKDGRLGTTHQLAIPYRSGSSIRGFAFRTITGAEPKYLNSPGMDRKGFLFNLSPLKGSKDLVVVEGYLDALRATVCGFDNVVAVAGAHLGKEHLEQAIKYGARKVTLLLDNDEAGREATASAITLLKSFPQLKAYVAVGLPPDIKDVDALLGEAGEKELQKAIDNAIPAWSYELYYLHLGPFIGKRPTPKEQDQLIEDLVAAASTLEPIDRDRFRAEAIHELKELGVTGESLKEAEDRLLYKRKRDQDKKDLERLLRSVSKDLENEDPGKAFDHLGEGLQELRIRKGADLLLPVSYTGWLESMSTARPALRTGYASLDKVARIPQAALTLVAGRPRHGKTTLLYNLLLSMAEVYPSERFLFFTYEEPSSHILTKLLNRTIGEDLSPLYHQYEEAHTNYSYLKAYLRNKREDVAHIEAGKRKLQDLLDSGRIQVMDGGYTVEELDSIISGEASKGHKVGAVFLDYIQRMSTRRPTQDKRTEIAHISDQLLQIAKRTELPLILGAQFGRAATSPTGEKRPSLENLKEAGNLEEDANLVLSVYNEAAEKETAEDGQGFGREVSLELRALKNRDGAANGKTEVTLDTWTGNIKDSSLTW